MKELWTWCWRCVILVPSTGVAYQGGSWGSSVLAPSSHCPSRSFHPSRVCRYEPHFVVDRVLGSMWPLLANSCVCLFVSEHFWFEAHRYISEEDVRIWRHCTSVCGLPVYEQRVLGVLLTFLHFRHEWTNCGILHMTLSFFATWWNNSVFYNSLWII